MYEYHSIEYVKLSDTLHTCAATRVSRTAQSVWSITTAVQSVWSIVTAVHESMCVGCQKVSHNIYIYVYINIRVYKYHSVEYVKLSDTLHTCAARRVSRTV